MGNKRVYAPAHSLAPCATPPSVALHYGTDLWVLYEPPSDIVRTLRISCKIIVKTTKKVNIENAFIEL